MSDYFNVFKNLYRKLKKPKNQSAYDRWKEEIFGVNELSQTTKISPVNELAIYKTHSDVGEIFSGLFIIIFLIHSTVFAF